MRIRHVLPFYRRSASHTIREASERLIGAGLLMKRYGEGIWFTDAESWPLERLADEILALRDAAWSRTLLDDLVQQHRASIGEIAHLAAQRRGEGDLADLEARLSMLKRALSYRDDHLIARDEADLLSGFIDTAHSRAFRLSLNAFNLLYLRLDVRRPPGTSWSTPLTWQSLIDTLRRSSTSTSRVLSMEMMNPIYQEVERLFAARMPAPGLYRESPEPGRGVPS